MLEQGNLSRDFDLLEKFVVRICALKISLDDSSVSGVYLYELPICISVCNISNLLD